MHGPIRIILAHISAFMSRGGIKARNGLIEVSRRLEMTAFHKAPGLFPTVNTYQSARAKTALIGLSSDFDPVVVAPKAKVRN